MAVIKNKSIGEKIKSARKEIGYSQKDLAKELKISDKAVSSYEVGRAKPSFQTLTKISKTVKKPITYFDQNTNTVEIDIATKFDRVEKELKEIKILLKKKKMY